jgi:ribose 5-phosphate isomerase A
MDRQTQEKQQAGERAAAFVESGMVVGLGTGSTVYWTIRSLGELVRGGLSIRAVPTSRQTEALAVDVGIPLTSFDEVSELDLTIDGADEVGPELNLVKGGGGALLREKLVASASKRLVIVVDSLKLVPILGAFPLPVEIVPFAHEVTLRRLQAVGCEPRLRLADGKPFVTDNGNFVADCRFGTIPEPVATHREIKLLTGVVETGLFVGMTEIVVVGTPSGVDLLTRHA